MSNLLTDIVDSIGDETIEKTGKKFNLSSELAKELSDDALSAFLGGLAKNSQDSNKAKKIVEVLKKDHLNNLDKKEEIISGNLDKKASGILKHTLGEKEGMMVSFLSKRYNLSEKESKDFLESMAPLFMGALAKITEKTNMDSGVLSQVLDMAVKTDLAKDLKNNGILSVLDLDKDGKIVDDLPKIWAGILSLLKFFKILVREKK